MKKCFKCGDCKPLSEFYKHKKMADGHLNKCKTCARRDSTEHRDKNLDKVRAYDRDRAKNPHRIACNIENTRRYRINNRKRYSANAAVAKAVKSGAIQKLPCWVCGSDKVEGHHPDYDSPLDVVWLCAVHHREIHLKHNR